MRFPGKPCRSLPSVSLVIVLALCLSACSLTARKELAGIGPGADLDVQDVKEIPQRFDDVARAAAGRFNIEPTCSKQLLDQFYRNFFRPWTAPAPLFDSAETKQFMKEEARIKWLGVNRRTVPRKTLSAILENCDLDTFPSRNEPAIAVAPGHLRGLPTPLPLYKLSEGPPFDMLSYPQVKLNEPLRVLHRTRDGAWLFVETPYSNGWLETRDVAFVDRNFTEAWMQSPHLVLTRDNAAISDARGIGTYQCKTGTILPLLRKGVGWWEASVASVGDGGRAVVRSTPIPGDAAAPFPVPFDAEHVTQVGDPLLGQPYGWGELYGLRDCSALLRDFFVPFGIWLPRTARDQMASLPRHVKLDGLEPEEKEALIKSKALPFLTLLYKPGHIMLYVGMDQQGRPLVFQDAWSIRVKDKKERTHMIGGSVITTLQPGAELGLVPGGSLLERASEMGTVTARCAGSSGSNGSGQTKKGNPIQTLRDFRSAR